ncbi:MAG: zf-HC2 domain-containing protein, partial [candidate division KSB1 bacterium]|nr:zf-HC2 domain-containing protein [candidate division KSB1 bacterium]
MNCQQVQKRLSAFQDGELPASMMTAIAQHLKRCEGCSQSLTELQVLWDTLGQVDRIDQAPYFWAHVSQRLQAGDDRLAHR